MEKVKEIKKSIPLIEDKISDICVKHNVSSEELLIELVRFLDLIHNTNQKLSPSYVVDLAWHEFILFTRFYNQFCYKHYNRFIHHTPSKNTDPEIFVKTIREYINHYNQPNAQIWGQFAEKEWQALNCGSCHN